MHLAFIYLLILNLILFYFVNKIFIKFKIVDYPDNKLKKHKLPIPYSGGFIIILNLIFLILFQEIFIANYVFAHSKSILVFIVILFLIGFIDDILNISVNLRLISLSLLLLVFLNYFSQFILFDINFRSINLHINIGNYGIIFTLLCLLAFMQASNMMDGINCLYGFYCFVSILYILFFEISLIIFLIPSLICFIYYNFKEKSFMGDGGNYFLSFLIGITFIHLSNSNRIFADDVFVAMSIPGYDMIRLFFVRIFNKKNPFYGDRNHLHHLFLKKNKKNKAIFLSILTISSPIILKFIIEDNFKVIITSLILYLIILILLKRKKNGL